MPLVQTRYKQLAKVDTPAEIKMSDSQRLTASNVLINVEEKQEKKGEDWKEKLGLYVFLIVSCYILYLSMHPNKKV